MDNKRFADKIADLCEQAGCKEKIAKIHFEQALRGWHPHPPQEFLQWWNRHLDYREGIDVKRAYNCETYRQAYLSDKELGIVDAEVLPVAYLEERT